MKVRRRFSEKRPPRLKLLQRLYILRTMKHRCAITLFFVFVFAASSGAQTILDEVPFLSSAEAETLASGEGVTRFFFSREEAVLRYAPDTFASPGVSKRVSSMDPTLGLESLYFIPYEKGDTPAAAYEKAAEILFSVSTMEGIEYYSASRERMRTLFTESTVTDAVESGASLDDLSFDRNRRSADYLVRQTDLTFGTHVYRTKFEGDGETLWFSMVNLTKMRYKFIKMVDPEHLEIHLVLKPVRDGILFYGVCSVESISFFGLERNKKDSFYYRIEALETWFETQYRDTNPAVSMQ